MENVTGGSLNDTIIGNDLANALTGGAGNDTFGGRAGNDTLIGGAGNDTYRFDTDNALGSDTINEAGGGINTLDFSATTTRAVAIDLGNAAAQVVNAGLTLTLSAGNTIENVIGGALGDTLTGNTLNNTLTGGAGNDTLTGRAGNDTYRFGTATAAEVNTVIELLGGGIDRLDFSALAATDPVTVNLTSDTALAVHANRTVKTGATGQAAYFENVTGGAGNDTITGNAADNVLVGGAGNDTLDGGPGNDTLDGGSGTGRGQKWRGDLQHPVAGLGGMRATRTLSF